MKILTILGARPQFIKAASVSRAFRNHARIEETIVHTGQHFDEQMSAVFFSQMQIQKPAYNLNINSLGHGAMTGRMLEKLEMIMLDIKPDWVLVYGDTNSTLAGSLCASKLHIPVAHVEAGLRSHNMNMPEEINRILTDRISKLLFCPTDQAVANLKKEGFEHFDTKIIQTGDVMYDSAMFYADKAVKPEFDITDKFLLTTIHREENTDNIENLHSIFVALNELSSRYSVVMPLHPRTKKMIEANSISVSSEIIITEPLGYLEMLYMLKNCTAVLTDSGGLQKEAFFFKKPCITLRSETEWVELVKNGYNIIAGTEKNKIIECVEIMLKKNLNFDKYLYGKGNAAEMIAESFISS